MEPKVVELLADLHTGTQAAVKLAGEHGDWLEIGRGVRQGCVIAPLLFNIYFDCVVRLLLAETVVCGWPSGLRERCCLGMPGLVGPAPC